MTDLRTPPGFCGRRYRRTPAGARRDGLVIEGEVVVSNTGADAGPGQGPVRRWARRTIAVPMPADLGFRRGVEQALRLTRAGGAARASAGQRPGFDLIFQPAFAARTPRLRPPTARSRIRQGLAIVGRRLWSAAGVALSLLIAVPSAFPDALQQTGAATAGTPAFVLSDRSSIIQLGAAGAVLSVDAPIRSVPLLPAPLPPVRRALAQAGER